MRGKGSYAPFLPGGLDEAAAAPQQDEEEQEEEDEEDGWKTRAPGLKRGVQLSGGEVASSISLILSTAAEAWFSRRVPGRDAGPAVDRAQSEA